MLLVDERRVLTCDHVSMCEVCCLGENVCPLCGTWFRTGVVMRISKRIPPWSMFGLLPKPASPSPRAGPPPPTVPKLASPSPRAGPPPPSYESIAHIPRGALVPLPPITK